MPRLAILMAAVALGGCYDFDSLSSQFHRDAAVAPDLVFVFPSMCKDGMKDGNETDVDCGGSCKACANGLHCLHAGDCQSAICANNICVGSNCSDGIKNGDETDIDCGGLVCPPCSDGKTCIRGQDCQSGICTNMVCVQ
jgi:hypothetical protein